MKIFHRRDAETQRRERNALLIFEDKNQTRRLRPFSPGLSLSASLRLCGSIPLLADASPSEIGTWVNVGMLFLNGAVAIVTILSVNRSQKREVTFAFEPASKEEFERHVLEQAQSLHALNLEITALREEMRKDRDQLLLAGENRVSKLHERINTILEAVSELRGRIATHYTDF